MNGLINLIKPPGITSHKAVLRIRKLAKVKVGHTGTLDPAASGVLLLCLGKATRFARFYTNYTKEYVATMRLGVVTSTDDAEGEILSSVTDIQIKEEDLPAVFSEFVGTLEQTPPAYSAVHFQGQRLYRLARRGEEVKVPARSVLIAGLEILGIALPYVSFRITCSKGTYIRSLCRDIGVRLGVGAHLSFLVRTRVGGYSLKDAVPLSALTSRQRINDSLLPLGENLKEFPALSGAEDAIIAIICGRALAENEILNLPGPLILNQYYRVFTREGQFVALAQGDYDDTGKLVLKPKLVLADSGL